MIPTQDDIIAALRRNGTQMAGNDPDRHTPPPLPMVPQGGFGGPNLVPAQQFRPSQPINPHLPSAPYGEKLGGALSIPPPPFKMAGDVIPFPVSPQVSGSRIANTHNMWRDYENRFGIPRRQRIREATA